MDTSARSFHFGSLIDFWSTTLARITTGSLIERRWPGWPANQAANQSASPATPQFRQFYRYLHRSSKPGSVAEPIWPHLPTESSFVPYFLSEKDILNLL